MAPVGPASCGACNTGVTGRSNDSRYDSKLHQPPPRDWVCADCLGGVRGAGDDKVAPCFRGKGEIVPGGQTWCLICLRSNAARQVHNDDEAALRPPQPEGPPRLPGSVPSYPRRKVGL